MTFQIRSLLVIFLSAILIGCGSSDDDEVTFLRVLHASPDAPNVDILVDDEVILENVSYQMGSGYLELDAGVRDISLRVSGTDTIALSEQFNLDEDGRYSVIAQNTLSNLALKLVNETDRFNNSTADVTVAHASPGAGNVDIYITANGASLPGTPSLGDVPFDGFAELLDQAAATYQIRITGPGSSTVVYDSSGLDISSDVFVVAVDSVTGVSPATLLIWTNTVTAVLDNSAEVRIVHAVDAVDVDVFLDNAELIGGFSFEQTTVGQAGASTTGYYTVTAGDHDVAISPANAGIGSALSNLSSTLTLDRGASYTVIAAGDVNDLPNAQLIVLVDSRSTSTGGIADVRLVHASAAAAADPVDIYVATAGGDISSVAPDFADVVIGQDTGYTALAPATYDITIAADGTRTAAVPGTSGLAFADGDVVTAIAVGNSVPNLAAIILNDAR